MKFIAIFTFGDVEIGKVDKVKQNHTNEGKTVPNSKGKTA